MPLLRHGVTAFKIKSGYDLNLESERNMLKVAQRLGEEFGVIVQKTRLAAHAIPGEFTGDPDGYIAFACDTVLPKLTKEGLVDTVPYYYPDHFTF